MSRRQNQQRVPRARFLFIGLFVTLAVLSVIVVPRFLLRNKPWTRVDDHTIALTGNIASGNLLEFEKVFDENVKTVVLNSGGGLVYEAVQIGMILKKAEVNVVVDGVCLSSCANYLFTAGRWKKIRNGVVGFHGNIRALMRQTGTEAAITDQLSELSAEEREEYQIELEQTLAWERTFFADMGIDQALFKRTQHPDKDMNNGKVYAFLLPTPATFIRYGIGNVEGVQSLKVKKRVEKETSLPLLID